MKLKAGQTFVNVRSGPGTAYAILGQLNAASLNSVIKGRNADGTWYQIAFPAAPDGVGWIFGDLVDVSGDTTGIAVVSAPPLPATSTPFAPLAPTTAPITPMPTATSTSAPATQNRTTNCAQAVNSTSGLSITCKRVDIIVSGSGPSLPTTYEVRVTLSVNNTQDNEFLIALPSAVDNNGRSYSVVGANSIWRRELSTGTQYTAVVAYEFPASDIGTSSALRLTLKFEASGSHQMTATEQSAQATIAAAGTPVLPPPLFLDQFKLSDIQLP